MKALQVLSALLVLLGAGCTAPELGGLVAANYTPAVVATAGPETSMVVPGAPSTAAVIEDCPVTLPVARESIPEAAVRPILNGSSHPDIASANLSMYGNDAMWVTMPREGVAPRGLRMFTIRLVDGVLTATGHPSMRRRLRPTSGSLRATAQQGCRWWG